MKHSFYLGKNCHIIYKGGRGISELVQNKNDSYELYITGEPEHMARRIQDFYKKQAQLIITPIVLEQCKKLNIIYNKIAFKNTKTRWGSASSNKNLSFNWRIIMASIDIIEYVAAHETAHLIEMNHKQSFWRLCEKLCPNSIQKHKWLKKNGYKFMQIDF